MTEIIFLGLCACLLFLLAAIWHDHATQRRITREEALRRIRRYNQGGTP